MFQKIFLAALFTLFLMAAFYGLSWRNNPTYTRNTGDGGKLAKRVEILSEKSKNNRKRYLQNASLI